MKTLALFPGAAHSTNLGLGTTCLGSLRNTSERLALLEAAFDAGIRHFDTAPSYGYGEAERLLGDFTRGKRDQLTITTKYGIEPPALVQARWVNLLARRVVRALPSVKAMLSRRAQQFTTHPAFTADAARKSLDRSLLALKTDRVELLLLHEPTLDDAASAEIHQFFEDELKKGRIRAYGSSGRTKAIEQIVSAGLPTASWLQFEDNVLTRNLESLRPGGERCITFRTFLSALGELRAWLNTNPAHRTEWASELQIDVTKDSELADLLLAASLLRNSGGVVLFSTRRASHIASAVAVASGSRFTPEQVKKCVELANRDFPSKASTDRRD
ncbi:MAG: aldo/keto reductase [Planctomycetia bacterium]|nr:aldo/keto reductase [Planctomycetia bacterium]